MKTQSFVGAIIRASEKSDYRNATFSTHFNNESRFGADYLDDRSARSKCPMEERLEERTTNRYARNFRDISRLA